MTEGSMKTQDDAYALLVRAMGWAEYVIGDRSVGWLPPGQHDGTRTTIIDRDGADIPAEIVPLANAVHEVSRKFFGHVPRETPIIFSCVVGHYAEATCMRVILTMQEWGIFNAYDFAWDEPLASIAENFTRWAELLIPTLPTLPEEVIEDAEPEPVTVQMATTAADSLHDQLRDAWPLTIRMEEDAMRVQSIIFGLRDAVTDVIAILREDAPDSVARALARLGSAR